MHVHCERSRPSSDRRTRLTSCSLDRQGASSQAAECTGNVGCVVVAGAPAGATAGANSIATDPLADSGSPPSPGSPSDTVLIGTACGNGQLDPGEACDPPASCPTEDTCGTTDSCLTSALLGKAETCDVVCSTQEITTCTSGDGCCAKGCKYPDDTDCSKSCGDGVVDAPELCEPSSTDKPCASSCDDGNACTLDVKTGTPEQCNVACTHMAVTAAKSGDGCCPPGANANNDSDCQPVCGNRVVERGETCDGNCPATCDDGKACTSDTALGSADRCDAMCTNSPITRPRRAGSCTSV